MSQEGPTAARRLRFRLQRPLLPVLSERLLRERLVSGATQTLLANTFMLAVSLGSAVLLARALGPDGRAALEALTFLPRALTPILQVGVSQANAYVTSQGRFNTPTLTRNTLLVAIGVGVPAAAACVPLVPVWLHQYTNGVLTLAAVFLFTIPLGILNVGLLGLILGQKRYTTFNLVRAVPPAIELVLLAALFMADRLTVTEAALVHVSTAGLLVLAVQIIVLGRPAISCATEHLRALKTTLKYGVRCLSADAASVANNSADRALLVTLLSPAEFGQFVVATRTAGLLLSLPNAIGTVLMPEAAGRTGPQAVRLTVSALILNAAMASGLAALLFFTIPILVPSLYGEAFAPAVVPAQVLLLGITLSGLAGIVGEGLKGMGRPARVAIADGIGGVVTAAGIMWLVPVAGLTGAAAGSAAGYAVGLIVLLVFFQRIRSAGFGRLVTTQTRTVTSLPKPGNGPSP